MDTYEERDITLRIGRERARLQLQIPKSPLSLPDFLPIVAALTDLTVAVAGREAQDAGRPVRCGPCCGACCRQLVPISPPEALRLRATVAKLDPEHRSRVLDRFEVIKKRMADAGLATRVRTVFQAPGGDRPDRRAVGLAYFALGLACPFLEEESCSIHPDRPLACREYLVSSDPIGCTGTAAAEPVSIVEVPRRLSALFALLSHRLLADSFGPTRTWLALVEALDDDAFDAGAVGGLLLPGPELFDLLLQRLAEPPGAGLR
jgi:Fe-S-cluster containining protein